MSSYLGSIASGLGYFLTPFQRRKQDLSRPATKSPSKSPSVRQRPGKQTASSAETSVQAQTKKPKTPNMLSVQGSRVVKKKVPASARKSPSTRPSRERENTALDFDGETNLGDPTTPKNDGQMDEDATLVGSNSDLVDSLAGKRFAEISKEDIMSGDFVTPETKKEFQTPGTRGGRTARSTSKRHRPPNEDATLIGSESESEDSLTGKKFPKLSKGEADAHILERALKISAEHYERLQKNDGIDRSNWTTSETALFDRLNMRGFEPLLPACWQMDFRTLPATLFTPNEKAFIDSSHGSDFRATKALSSLLNLGVKVRDRLFHSLPVEETLGREIQSYIKWSIKDAGLENKDYIPALTVATSVHNESVRGAVERVTKRLHALGNRYRQAWRITDAERKEDPERWEGLKYRYDPPTLFGIVIKSTVVAFVSYNSRIEGKEVRSIATFNFGAFQQDVWNGLAVAILVVTVRAFLVKAALLETAPGVLVPRTSPGVGAGSVMEIQTKASPQNHQPLAANGFAGSQPPFLW
ncbi:hypothetical protein MMC20_000310 [Loxospora ochrophaea]|nr:hypothetical protein [Loxospora ochrophaea]